MTIEIVAIDVLVVVFVMVIVYPHPGMRIDLVKFGTRHNCFLPIT